MNTFTKYLSKFFKVKPKVESKKKPMKNAFCLKGNSSDLALHFHKVEGVTRD